MSYVRLGQAHRGNPRPRRLSLEEGPLRLLRRARMHPGGHVRDSGRTKCFGAGVRGVRAIDLFAGMGGWDIGAAELGVEPIGIELDPSACATRNAAGLPTVSGDVELLDPREFAPCDLLIASPPCQGFSTAGKRDPRDPRNRLVFEPWRWIVALEPRFLAFGE